MGAVSLVPILGIAFIGIMSMKVDTNSLMVHLNEVTIEIFLT